MTRRFTTIHITFALGCLLAATLSYATPLDDARAGVAAGKRGDYAEAVRLFTRALDDGLSGPNRSIAFNNRGVVYIRQGQYGLAIEDYNEAIRLRPDYADAFNNRGNAYGRKGKYDRAIEDYNQAVRLKPDYALALRNRGRAYYALDQHSQAAADFTKDLDLGPKEAYAALWLYAATLRSGKDGQAELARRAGLLDLNAWPGPVVKFYLGRLKPDAVIAAANHHDVETSRGQGCEAQFYIGLYHSLHGNHVAAIPMLKTAAAACPTSFVEHVMAPVELEKLGR